ncbi:MAG: sulfite exporter TauE/SafE family protein [Flavobacteriales bacterium]|nr:sulfite exporter TauE/SafE family protein [Flavobacteriales bacterium]
MDWRLILSGAFVGLLVGFTGVGGGALMTPILLLVFGIAPTVAVGTDLWFAAITKMFATPVHHRRGLIDWQVVLRLWAGSLSASAITLWAMSSISLGSEATRYIQIAVACVVGITAVAMLFQPKLHAMGRSFRLAEAVSFKSWQVPLTVLAGALLGVLVTLTSIGAGALGAVMLVYLYPLRLTPPRLVATDIVHAIPLALFAGVGHALLGNVELTLLGNLLLGSVPTVIIGAMLSSRVPHGVVRIGLVLVLVAVGTKLLWTTLG